MKFLLMITAVALTLCLWTEANADLNPGSTSGTLTQPGIVLGSTPSPPAEPQATVPNAPVGSINDKVGTESWSHPERQGDTAGSMNDESSHVHNQNQTQPNPASRNAE